MEPIDNAKKYIKILAMSDTHDLHFRVDVKQLPKADIFIHAGDFTKFSAQAQFTRFRQFLSLLPYKYKVVIAGNHDFGLDKNCHKKNAINYINVEDEINKLKKVCIYLEHESVEIEGIKIFGSPMSLQFYDWGFMYKQHEGDALWSMIPPQTDIVVTHGPCYGILDETYDKRKVGCKSLLKHLQIIKPQIHICGHIHESYGMKEINGIRYYNASNVNLSYKYINPPMLIDVEVRKPTVKQSQ